MIKGIVRRIGDWDGKGIGKGVMRDG